MLVSIALHPASARGDDAASSFNAATNSAAARWCYGHAPGVTGALTLYTAPSTDAFQLQYWKRAPDNGSYVCFNPTGAPKTPVAGITIPPRTLSLQPGSTGQYAAVRWKAPVAASYTIVARFTARSANSSARDVAVRRGTEVLFGRWLDPAVTGNSASMSVTLSLGAGETVDFLVGPADGYNAYDVMGLDATINAEPAPFPAGPVITFGTHRFAMARWPGDVFDAIAFDAANRRIVGDGKIQNLCGGLISAGPSGGVGMAMDPLTSDVWDVTPDRVVRRWNGATLLDTVFTAPLTFMVPGSGLDTMESVRGIALDSSFVYFVDAGPNPGQIPSNAWFKFSRAGDPLESSRTTDLLAHLDLDPDALVDDITFVPMNSPVYPGRLLVALEHSGIQVLDRSGNFVDRFRWSTQALPPRDENRVYGKIAAFAGIAIDPATGNLYLEDNDSGNAQVWVRLPQAASRLAIAIGGPQMWLYDPQPGCNLPLWEVLAGPANNVFGLAYRGADRSLYSLDYSSSDLNRADPRTGAGMRVASSGVESLWGVAWDPGRDLLYAGTEVAGNGLTRVVAIDPRDGAAAPLPLDVGFYVRDLAFDTSDSSLYGIAVGTTPQLVRINLETGAGAVVGNTVSANGGLDFDPTTGKLIAIANARLYAIDPASGAAESLLALPATGPFEGLAIVPVPANPLLVSAADLPTRDVMTLRAWPNPARGAVTLQFELPEAAEARVAVYDVMGRRVRAFDPRALAAGVHLARWDGDDDQRRPLAAGVYFVRVETGPHARIARVVRVE